MATRLQEEVELLKESNDKMSHALDYQNDPEMLELVARQRGYIKYGESVFMDISG